VFGDRRHDPKPQPQLLIIIFIALALVFMNFYLPAAVNGQEAADLGSTESAGMVTYEYSDYGVKIDYPEHWLVEEFAFDDRHFKPHPGHLPGVPFQFFKPNELDMKPQNTEIYVLGLYPPFDEGQQVSDTKVFVIVEKVGLGHDLAAHVKSHVVERITEKNIVGSSDSPAEISYEVVDQRDSTLSGNRAITLVSDKKWGWNSEINAYENGQRTMRIFTLEDDRVYSIQYAASSEDYDRYLSAAENIAATLKITSSGLYKTVGAAGVAVGVGAVSGFLILKARRKKGSLTSLFITNVRRLLPAALGIEILCISAAEIGGNTGLYMFGYNAQGIGLSYVLVCALAGFTTFAVILGRYRRYPVALSFGGPTANKSGMNQSGPTVTSSTASCDCCSILETSSNLSFLSGLKYTLGSFALGLKRLAQFHKEPNKAQILRTSIVLLLTAESGCILTAATVDFVLYQYSLFLSVPVSLVAGTMAVAAPHAFRLARRTRRNIDREEKMGPNSEDSPAKLNGIKSLKDGQLDSNT
jgi:hypothetical protein